MDATTVRLLAGLMALANAAAWLWWSRSERPGRGVDLQATIRPPVLLGWVSDLLQVTPLAYPVLVVVSPRWGYESSWHWSSPVDPVLQVAGVVLWSVGVVVATWAATTVGRYLAIDGLAVDHELVTQGPYRHVRHPVYTAFMAIAAGTALVFRSWLLVAVALATVAGARWWAAAEEHVLLSSEQLGEAYRRYADRTGRFLPRVRPSPTT